jgi:hypothetical protein
MNPIVTSDQERYNKHLIISNARAFGDAWIYEVEIQHLESGEWLPLVTDNDHVYETSEDAVRAGMDAGRGVADN